MTMATEPIASIHAAEQAAANRIAVARSRAEGRRRAADRKAEELIAQAREAADREAAALRRDILAEADEETAALTHRGLEATEQLRRDLSQKIEEAAARIIAYILP